MSKSKTYDRIAGMYLNKLQREHAFLSLLKVGVKYFQDTYRIRKINELEIKIKKQFSKKKINGMPVWQNFDNFSKNALIDYVKIIICFENYMKGMLISKGFIVHRISGDVENGKFKSLDNRNKPVKISDYKKVENYILGPKNDLYHLRGLEHQTISFNKLLKRPYQRIIKLPQEIIAIIDEINTYRNSLHLRLAEGSSFSPNSANELKRLVRFVNKHMIRTYNDRIRKFWGNKFTDRYLINIINP